MIIPLAKTGGGWTTELTLMNPSPNGVQVNVEFKMSDGNSGVQPVLIDEIQHYSWSTVLNSLGSKKVKAYSDKDFVSCGYWLIEYVGKTAPIVSTELVRGVERIGVYAQPPTRQLWLPFDNVGGTSALVVVKTGPTQTLVFEYVDEDGVYLGSHRGTFPGQDSVTIRTDQYQPSTIGKRGMVSIRQDYREPMSAFVGQSFMAP